MVWRLARWNRGKRSFNDGGAVCSVVKVRVGELSPLHEHHEYHTALCFAKLRLSKLLSQTWSAFCEMTGCKTRQERRGATKGKERQRYREMPDPGLPIAPAVCAGRRGSYSVIKWERACGPRREQWFYSYQYRFHPTPNPMQFQREQHHKYHK